MNKRARLEAYGNISLASGRIPPPPAKPKKPRDGIAKGAANPAAPTQVSSENPPRKIGQNRSRENTGQSFRMKPNWREKIHSKMRLAFNLAPETALPPYFADEDIRPAKIGIRNDLLAYFKVTQLTEEQADALNQALSMFFGTFEYKRASSVATHRFDLFNVPVVEMTAEDIKHNRDCLHQALENRKKKTADQKANTRSEKGDKQ